MVHICFFRDSAISWVNPMVNFYPQKGCQLITSNLWAPGTAWPLLNDLVIWKKWFLLDHGVLYPLKLDMYNEIDAIFEARDTFSKPSCFAVCIYIYIIGVAISCTKWSLLGPWINRFLYTYSGFVSVFYGRLSLFMLTWRSPHWRGSRVGLKKKKQQHATDRLRFWDTFLWDELERKRSHEPIIHVNVYMYIRARIYIYIRIRFRCIIISY